MYQTTIIPTPTKAPIPAALAVFGLLSFHTKKRISPTTGMQHPNRPQPKPPLSTTAGVASF